ncbi:hypothetical protein B0J17DRAFT_667113, partial [Rhizoctonia solani]
MSDTTAQQPSKVNGQFHSIKGTLVEVVGNLFGWTSWTESGRKEHEAGEAEITAAQAQAFAEGTIDRVSAGRMRLWEPLLETRRSRLQVIYNTTRARRKPRPTHLL